jgi:hypothetical protein
MKVYTVMVHYNYEGEALCGVFSTREAAYKWFEAKERGGDSHRLYISNLDEELTSVNYCFEYVNMSKGGM